MVNYGDNILDEIHKLIIKIQFIFHKKACIKDKMCAFLGILKGQKKTFSLRPLANRWRRKDKIILTKGQKSEQSY
jgi:hypothetical protein